MSDEDLASPDPELRRLAAQALAQDERPEAAARRRRRERDVIFVS